MVLHLDVGLFQSIKAGSIFEERAHLIIKYVSWVQNDVNQFGLYLRPPIGAVLSAACAYSSKASL